MRILDLMASQTLYFLRPILGPLRARLPARYKNAGRKIVRGLGINYSRTSAATDEPWRTLFDPAWYLNQYPDVAKSGIHPLQHYLTRGWREGRQPHPLFLSGWYVESFMGPGAPSINPVLHYLDNWTKGEVRPNPAFDPIFVAGQVGALASLDPLSFALQFPDHIDRTCAWFSRREYVNSYPDLKNVPFPELHFLDWGLWEGRRPRPSIQVQRSTSPSAGYTPTSRFLTEVGRFTLRDQDIVILEHSIPTSILNQIYEQGLHDPRVFAPGRKALPNLRQVVGSDLMARDGIDVSDILSKVGDGCDVVIFLPAIQIGGAEKVAMNLMRFFREKARQVLVVVSEQREEGAQANLQHPFFEALRGQRIVFWSDITMPPEANCYVAALLLNKLRPQYIFAMNSVLGLNMISTYGRALSTFARMYTSYFSEPPDAAEGSLPARFLIDTVPYASILTDNTRTAKSLLSRIANVYDNRAVVLPSAVSIRTDAEFSASLKQRLKRLSNRENFRALWISRVEPSKGTAVLQEISRCRPDIDIDIYGPIRNPEGIDISGRSNLKYHGPYRDLNDIDFGSYDVFLFTSEYEGMPNVVLEMTQYALPIITTDVGGLRETFSESMLFFVNNAEAPEAGVRFFLDALLRVENIPSNELERRLIQTRDAVCSRHSWKAFAAGANSMVLN